MCFQIWDLRTGGIFETLKYDHPVTALQFDTRKIVAATGQNGIDVRTPQTVLFLLFTDSDILRFPSSLLSISCNDLIAIYCCVNVYAYGGGRWSFAVQIYNRTTMQHSSLLTNGHTRPAEKLRYMDKYLVSGGRDATVKIWAL